MEGAVQKVHSISEIEGRFASLRRPNHEQIQINVTMVRFFPREKRYYSFDHQPIIIATSESETFLTIYSRHYE
jgi:hypothetical protein